jgi:uncharacterized protein YdhG (YjbR/CyaY superfamily)
MEAILVKTKPKKRYNEFTVEEKAAMRDRVRELKVGAADGEKEVLAKLAGMSKPDREIGERLHAIIKAAAPSLAPRLWYGMPAYTKNGKLLCHFQPAEKFKTRYPMVGFSDLAKLDDGDVWPVYFAIANLTPAAEAKLAALVKKAAG